MTLNIFTYKRFRDVSIAKKLYFAVGIMATLIAIELFTLWFATSTLSSLRAYVSGEGLWSKGQKDAVYHLQNYGHTYDENDYALFLEFMKVPLGDHKTRVELLKPQPNMDSARQGFIEGRNNPYDVDGMIHLFRRFHNISYISKAIRIWGEADPLIMKLEPIGAQLHAEINSPSPSKEKIKALLQQIEATNMQLTALEDEFSYTLGEASRWLESLVLRLLFAVALTVELTGLLLTISVSRTIQKGLNEIIEASKKIAKGDFSIRAKAFSHDEIGVLANSFNQMAEELGSANDELQKTENKFRSLLENAPDAKVIVGRNDTIQLVNAQTEKIFGYTRNELIGKKVEMLIPDEYRNDHTGHRNMFFEGPQARPMGSGLELWAQRKDGTKFPVEISLSPLQTEEGLLVTAAIRDVTEKRMAGDALKEYARRLERSNDSLEQFAYVASHDLQEPLRTITNFVQLLEAKEKDGLDETSKRYMQHIVNSANRMKDLVKDMLHFSRLGKNRIVESVDTQKVVAEVLEDMDLFIKENNASINVAGLPVLKTSRSEAQQLFYNLVNNAIKYRKPDTPPKVEIDALEQANGAWLFWVKDNGIGIEKQYSEKIFTIFQRLHNQNEYNGTGIGLSTCKKIVELNGGAIWVDSEPGVGSTFYFTFTKS